MRLVKSVHGMVETTDLEKHRQSQDHIGTILGNNKEVGYTETDIQGMYGEWVRVNRAHRKENI